MMNKRENVFGLFCSRMDEDKAGNIKNIISIKVIKKLSLIVSRKNNQAIRRLEKD